MKYKLSVYVKYSEEENSRTGEEQRALAVLLVSNQERDHLRFNAIERVQLCAIGSGMKPVNKCVIW